MTPLISIIIPCYNVEKYIDRCLRSLAVQTVGIGRLDIICVDDCSSDGTRERLGVWQRRFPDNIRLICHAENKRQGGARNTGIAAAVADWVGFVDADDWVDPQMYAVLYGMAMGGDAPCDYASCRYDRDYGDLYAQKAREEKQWPVISGQPQLDVPSVVRTSIPDILARKSFLIGRADRKTAPGASSTGSGIVCRLYRKAFLDGCDLAFPEQTAYEDNYFAAVTSMYAMHVCFTDASLYHYFVNADSTVQTRNRAYQYMDRMNIELMKLAMYRERGFFDTYHDEIEFHFLRLYYLNTMNLLLTRFDEPPVAAYRQLVEGVLREFPDYTQNPYIDRFHELEHAILATIGKGYDAEGLRGLAERYRALVSTNIG